MLKNSVSFFLPNLQDQEEFALWAFGEDYTCIAGSINFMKAWNERHSDKLNLLNDGHMSKDIEKMVDVWKCHCCNN